MSDTIIGAFIGVGGAIVGAILAGPVTYFFSRKLIAESHENTIEAIKIAEFSKAASEFRAAFVDYIYAIRHCNMTDADQGWFDMNKIHTAEVEIAHEKAKIRFEPFINKDHLAGFNAAWETYRHWPDHFHDQNDKRDKKPIVLSHIENLLKYAVTPK